MPPVGSRQPQPVVRRRRPAALARGIDAAARRDVWRAVATAMLVAAAPVGCRTSVGPGLPADLGRSLAAQVAAVRDGRATTIVAALPPTAEEWESMRGLAGLRELVLERGVADDDRAAVLATLPDVERLVLRDSPLTDAGFRALAACRSLRDLNVPQADCTAEGVRALGKLHHLRSLRLGGRRLEGPEVCAAVATIPGLRSLHLVDIPIGDRGLAGLRRLPGLWNLYLDGAGVSDEAWVEYFRERPDVHVHVDQAHHDRDPGRHDAGAARTPSPTRGTSDER